ncbi:MAG: 4Fe-4S binding protein [Anaerolineales bacterium]|nr:4Fe-4S binding protein [Anaerolineales bacterium]
MAKGRIVIDDDRCKGCTLCTTICPQHVVVMDMERLNVRGYHPALYQDPLGECTGCGLCAVICPDACITVYRFRKPELKAQTALV